LEHLEHASASVAVCLGEWSAFNLDGQVAMRDVLAFMPRDPQTFVRVRPMGDSGPGLRGGRGWERRPSS
jgi:hypothetical protein